MLATYGIAFFYLLQLGHSIWSVNSVQTYFNLTLLNYLIFSLVMLIGNKAIVSYERSIFLCVLAVILVNSFFDNFIGLALLDSADQSLWFLYVLPSLWLLLFSFFYLHRQLQTITFFAFLIFGIVLIALGYFDVFILFVILTWALKNKDRIVYGITLLVFATVLWQLYYSLQLSFLAKSASILVSGIMLLALYRLLLQEAKNNCVEGEN